MKNTYYEQIGALPHKPGVERAYVIGYLLSIVCVLGAYILVAYISMPPTVLVGGVVVLACIQCVVQGIFFLHIGGEERSRLKLFMLCFALIVVGILLSGSLWIMSRLSERMMVDPAHMEQYMQSQGGF